MYMHLTITAYNLNKQTNDEQLLTGWEQDPV